MSKNNIETMSAFAEAWPEAEFVQEALAQLPWGQQIERELAALEGD